MAWENECSQSFPPSAWKDSSGEQVKPGFHLESKPDASTYRNNTDANGNSRWLKRKQAQVLVVSVGNDGKGFKRNRRVTSIHERYLPGQGYYRHHLYLVRRNLERNSNSERCQSAWNVNMLIMSWLTEVNPTVILFD